MKGLYVWASELIKRSPVVRNVLTLMSGTALSQVVAIVIAIFLARMFNTSDFGRMDVYNSVVALLVAIASLRYDMTMMLPKTDIEARVLKRLATRSIVVVAVIASVIGIVFQDWITAHYKNDVQLSRLFPFIGISVFLIAEVAVLQYWYNRKSDYKTIAVNRVQQTVGMYGGQLFFGGIGFSGVLGLFLGTISGQAYAWLNLGRKARELREPLPKDAPSMWSMALRYKKMPLLNGPNAILDAVRLNGITLMLGAASLSSLGQFNMAWRMLQVPIGLIQGAVSQVFFQKLATVERGDMETIVKFVIKRGLLLGVAPFALLYILSPWAFPFVFGQQWAGSGDFARALTPWLMMTLITSPISTVFIVTEHQQVVLLFSVFYTAVPLSIMYFSPWSLLVTIYLLSAAMGAMLVVNVLLAIWVARRFDRAPDAVSE